MLASIVLMQGERAVEELSCCTIDEVRECWERAARPWSQFVRGGRDVFRDRLHGPALLTACGEVRGRRVLDLGCGEGWASRELAYRGAIVTGVDLARPMITEARAHPMQAMRPVDYRVMDATEVDRHVGTETFDLVIACMSLHTMPNPAGAVRAACRVLAPEGRLVCSIPHPITHMRGGSRFYAQDGGLYIRAGDYFRSAPYRVRWDVHAAEPWETIRWSRPCSEYTAMLTGAGLVLCDELEPYATEADLIACEQGSDADACERLRSAAQLPYYLILVAERTPLASRPD